MKKTLVSSSMAALLLLSAVTACSTPSESPKPSASTTPETKPSEAPTPAASATPEPVKASIIKIDEVKFAGKSADRVGPGSLLKPNKQPDGQVNIKISTPSEIEIKTIEVIQTDEKGGDINKPNHWTTALTDNWVLGVFELDGSQINKDRTNKNLMAVNGTRELQLFGESQYMGIIFFAEGKHYKVIITDTTGAKAEARFTS